VKIYPELTKEEKWRIDYERQKLFGAPPIYCFWKKRDKKEAKDAK